MAFQKTARKDSAFRIVCILPDFCFLPTPPTPPQAPPIPFPLTTDLGKAKSVARDVLINNSLVDLYGKCGAVELARQVFDRMPERDITS